MAFNFSDRDKRGEIIVPYILKKVWQDRDTKDTAEDIRYLQIIERFIQEDAKALAEQGDHHTFKGYVHPSSLNACMRQQWFKLTGAPATDTDPPEQYCRRQRIFANGDMMHLRWAALFEFYGILKAREVSVLDEERMLIGKRDADVHIPEEGDFIVDFKTSNPVFFDQMVNSGSPGDDYVAQINIYMHYAGVPRGAVIVENKANQDVVEFPISYDKVLVAALLDRATSIHAAVAAKKAPPKEYQEMNRPPCSWCNWRDVCNTQTLVKRLETGSGDKKTIKKRPKAKQSDRELLLKRLKAGKH